MQNHLRKVRMQKGVSIRDLSLLSGVSVSHISNYERGVKDITTEKLCKLALALQVDINTIITDGDIVNLQNNSKEID